MISYSDILIWRHRLICPPCFLLRACRSNIPLYISLRIWISQLPIIRFANVLKNIYGPPGATKRGNMINIALANASDVLYKYLRTPDQIGVNGQWTLPFRRIAAQRDNRWANCFRSTIAVRNFPEASNGRVNRRKLTNTSAENGVWRRKSEWSFGNESRGGWNVSLIYDVSRGKSGNESWSSVFAANRRGGGEGGRGQG